MNGKSPSHATLKHWAWERVEFIRSKIPRVLLSKAGTPRIFHRFGVVRVRGLLKMASQSNIDNILQSDFFFDRCSPVSSGFKTRSSCVWSKPKCFAFLSANVTEIWRVWHFVLFCLFWRILGEACRNCYIVAQAWKTEKKKWLGYTKNTPKPPNH